VYEAIGWLSAALFIICGVPQAYQSYKDGHSDGISSAFLLMWFAGEILGLIYILSIDPILLPIFVNYTFNLVVLGIIMKYKYLPRRSHGSQDRQRDSEQDFQSN